MAAVMMQNVPAVKNEILELGMHAVTYTMGTSYAYPFQLCYGENVVNALGEDVVIPVTLEFNVRELHEYLYPGLSYEPSAAVTEYSDYIARKSGYDRLCAEPGAWCRGRFGDRRRLNTREKTRHEILYR